MEDRQEQINRICEWMGWAKLRVFEDTEAHTFHKYLTTTPLPSWIVRVWVWDDAEGNIKAKVDEFDPFSDPSACAKIMDEVTKRVASYTINYDPVDCCWSCELAIAEGNGNSGSFESEMDAKMMALAQAIGA